MRYFEILDSDNKMKTFLIYIFTVIIILAGLYSEVNPIFTDSPEQNVYTNNITKGQFLKYQDKGSTILLGFTDYASQQKQIYKIEQLIGKDSLYISTSKKLYFDSKGRKYLVGVSNGNILLEDTITKSRMEFVDFVNTADTFTGIREVMEEHRSELSLDMKLEMYLITTARVLIHTLILVSLFYLFLILIQRWKGSNQSVFLYILLFAVYIINDLRNFNKSVEALSASTFSDKVSIFNYHDAILTQGWIFLASFTFVSAIYKFSIKEKIWSTKHYLLFTFLYFYCTLMAVSKIAYEITRFYFVHKYDTTGFDNMNVFTGAFILSILITVGEFLFRKFGKASSEKIKILKEQVLQSKSKLAALQSSVNPHFLYNSLNSIAALAKKDPERTEKMSLALSQFYKYTANREEQSMTSVKEELDMIEHYLDVEKIRFENRLISNIQYNEEALDFSIPYFLIQPLMENAIKYGYNNESNTITIGLDIELRSKELLIKVADSGLPFDENMNRGYGLKSVMKKLELMYPGQHTIEFVNKPKHVLITIIKN